MNWDKLKKRLTEELSDGQLEKLAKERGVPKERLLEAQAAMNKEVDLSIKQGIAYTSTFLKELAESYADAYAENPRADKLDEVIAWTAYHFGLLTQGVDAQSSMIQKYQTRIADLESLVTDLKRRLDNIDQLDIEPTNLEDVSGLN